MSGSTVKLRIHFTGPGVAPWTATVVTGISVDSWNSRTDDQLYEVMEEAVQRSLSRSVSGSLSRSVRARVEVVEGVRGRSGR